MRQHKKTLYILSIKSSLDVDKMDSLFSFILMKHRGFVFFLEYTRDCV